MQTERNIIKRFVIWTVAIFLAIPISLLAFVFVSPYVFPELWGSHSLGDGFYLMDFDGGEIVVQGTSISGKTCYGGTEVIPPAYCHYDSLGNVNEYVTDIVSDSVWIVARTYSNKYNMSYYYTLNKQYYLDRKIIGASKKYLLKFTDSISYEKHCQKTGMKINKLERVSDLW